MFQQTAATIIRTMLYRRWAEKALSGSATSAAATKSICRWEPVDIGVRVEVRNEVMDFLNKNLYEAKLVYHTPTFDDKVRTFCSNPSGEVATEYYENGLAVVNGHAYKSADYKTDNTNFALLVSKNFTKPFKTPIEYGKHIALLGNMLCDGKILVQTYGDFKRGRRTTEERLARNNLRPTLKDAVPGDLSLVLPYRIMLDIDEMLTALDKVTPGIASEETLLYGVEVKFYSNKVVVNDKFETNIKGLRAIGDGASVTRGLMQASANGISAAHSIVGNIMRKGLIGLNKSEQTPCCAICVYSAENDDGMMCSKKNKPTEPMKKCRKFEVDIMSLGARKRRVLSDDINPDDYSID